MGSRVGNYVYVKPRNFIQRPPSKANAPVSLTADSNQSKPFLVSCPSPISTATMPSATGQSWEKYQKTFADDEEPEKKITPLTDEYALYGLKELGFADQVGR